MAYLGLSRNIRLTTKTVALMNRLALLVLLLLPLAGFAQTKPFVREYTYRAGDDDSKNSARAIALEQVKRLLLQEVGTYLESEFSVQIIETVGGIKETARQDILSLTAGITQTKILDEKWDGQSFYLKAEIVVNLDDVMRRLTELKQDRSKYAELQEREKEARAVADSALAEIERLKQELAKARAEVDALRTADLKRQYASSSATLSAKEYLDNGNAKFNQKDYTGAIADYTQAIALDPKFAPAYNNRGIAKRQLQDYTGAIADYTQAIELDPKLALAYNNRGLAKRYLKDDTGAIADYTQAIEIDSNYAQAYHNRGAAKARLKDYTGAMADYTQAIALNPNYALAYYNLCCTYSLKGETAEAIKHLRRALELGYDNFNNIAKDTDLDNLRQLKAFQDLISQFKAKANKAKANN